MAAAALLLEGTLYFNQFSNGSPTKREQITGVAQFSMKQNSKQIDIASKDKGKYGSLVASIPIPQPSDFSVKIMATTGRALAAGLQGSHAAFSQGSGSITAQTFVANKGAYVDLGKKNIATAGLSVTNQAGSTTYVKDTDYSIDYVIGMLYIIPAGSIVDAAQIKVTATYGAVTGTRVVGSTVTNIRGEWYLDGRNLVDGLPAQITVYDATVTSDSEIDFMSDKPIEVSLKGRMAIPDGKSEPYELIYDQVLA
jgi:hypothetical protein